MQEERERGLDQLPDYDVAPRRDVRSRVGPITSRFSRKRQLRTFVSGNSASSH